MYDPKDILKLGGRYSDPGDDYLTKEKDVVVKDGEIVDKTPVDIDLDV